MCSVVLDKKNKVYQSFCRGEAITVFQNCTDFWNGKEVVPITEVARRTIKELMQHWNSESFDPIGYSYKPVTPDVEKMLLAHWNDGKPFDKELARSQTERQIFIGLVGFKHHKRKDAKKVCKQLEDAGIRPVLFSKEDMLKTKTVGADLGMDTDFNAWISLKDDDLGRINRDGNEVLPTGIENIKKHLEHVDKIPLQVQMFCDVDARTTEQMFQIY